MTDTVWMHSVGTIPFKVDVLEMATRKHVLYLRWRTRGNWTYQSLRRTMRDEKGQPLTGRARRDVEQWAIAQAEQKFAELRAGVSPTMPKAPLTLGEAWALIADQDTGKYPSDSRHRREVERELKHVVRILGSDTPWEALHVEQLTKLWRSRIRELRAQDETGIRGAEITISRLLTVAQWLRDRERIPKDACIAPQSWKRDLRKDWQQLTDSDRVVEPQRPRYTVEEYRRLFDATWQADPRYGLMYALGAELRAGQVARMRRSDVDLEHQRFRVWGSGNKRGTWVKMTPGQLAAVDRAFGGYLAKLEEAHRAGELADYCLFPRGQMPGGRKGNPIADVERHGDAKHVGEFAMRKWHREAEQLAKIPHLDGRGWYGARRLGVDEAKKRKISREGLKAHGGWADSQVPDAIYAEQEQEYAQDEAAEVRASIRGEHPTTQENE